MGGEMRGQGVKNVHGGNQADEFVFTKYNSLNRISAPGFAMLPNSVISMMPFDHAIWNECKFCWLY